jgi:hypothetical protein
MTTNTLGSKAAFRRPERGSSPKVFEDIDRHRAHRGFSPDRASLHASPPIG